MTLITDDMKTEWYPYTVYPVRAGAYEIRFTAIGHYEIREWDGKRWLLRGFDGTRLVSAFGDVNEFEPQRAWRGLKAPYDGQTS